MGGSIRAQRPTTGPSPSTISVIGGQQPQRCMATAVALELEEVTKSVARRRGATTASSVLRRVSGGRSDVVAPADDTARPGTDHRGDHRDVPDRPRATTGQQPLRRSGHVVVGRCSPGSDQHHGIESLAAIGEVSPKSLSTGRPSAWPRDASGLRSRRCTACPTPGSEQHGSGPAPMSQHRSHRCAERESRISAETSHRRPASRLFLPGEAVPRRRALLQHFGREAPTGASTSNSLCCVVDPTRRIRCIRSGWATQRVTDGSGGGGRCLVGPAPGSLHERPSMPPPRGCESHQPRHR